MARIEAGGRIGALLNVGVEGSEQLRSCTLIFDIGLTQDWIVVKCLGVRKLISAGPSLGVYLVRIQGQNNKGRGCLQYIPVPPGKRGFESGVSDCRDYEGSCNQH